MIKRMLNPNRIFGKIHDVVLFHYDSPLSVPLVRVSNRHHNVVTSDRLWSVSVMKRKY
jgi:hypothetical protein